MKRLCFVMVCLSIMCLVFSACRPAEKISGNRHEYTSTSLGNADICVGAFDVWERLHVVSAEYLSSGGVSVTGGKLTRDVNGPLTYMIVSNAAVVYTEKLQRSKNVNPQSIYLTSSTKGMICGDFYVGSSPVIFVREPNCWVSRDKDSCPSAGFVWEQSVTQPVHRGRLAAFFSARECQNNTIAFSLWNEDDGWTEMSTIGELPVAGAYGRVFGEDARPFLIWRQHNAEEKRARKVSLMPSPITNPNDVVTICADNEVPEDWTISDVLGCCNEESFTIITHWESQSKIGPSEMMLTVHKVCTKKVGEWKQECLPQHLKWREHLPDMVRGGVYPVVGADGEIILLWLVCMDTSVSSRDCGSLAVFMSIMKEDKWAEPIEILRPKLPIVSIVDANIDVTGRFLNIAVFCRDHPGMFSFLKDEDAEVLQVRIPVPENSEWQNENNPFHMD